MEEILASIKRVIAEDGRPAARPARGSRPAEAPRPPDEDDVLELQDPVGEGETIPADDAALGAAVREMLKPLLKDWLDSNLPDMVEELVTREIARITGKSL